MDYIQQITELGYCKIENVYTEEETAKTLALVKEWEKKAPRIDDQYIPRLNKGNKDIYCLQNKDKYFLDIIFKSDEVEEILIHFLNDKFYKQIPENQPNYILRHVGARSSVEALPFHIDSFIPYIGEHVIAMQVAIFLEDSTVENGCTLVRHKSHQWGTYASQFDLDYQEVTAKRGDVLIWDSRLHHGCLKNNTKGTRWTIVSTFTRWWVKQMFHITEGLSKDTLNQLTKKEKSILGYYSIPYNNEYEGIDMKNRYIFDE